MYDYFCCIVKKDKNQSKCTDYRRLLIYFASNLIVCHRFVDAVKVIEQHGTTYHDDKFTQANMHKLFSVILFKENDINTAIIEIDRAIKIFSKLKYTSGLSLWHIFRAYLRFFKISDDSSCWSDDSQEKKSEQDKSFLEDIEKFYEHYKNSGHLKNTKLCKYADNAEQLMSLDFKREVALITLHPIISNVNDNSVSVKKKVNLSSSLIIV